MSEPASSRLEVRGIPGPGWFDADGAPDRRGLHTCIHCGLCLTACPTYRETRIEPESPRGRIYLMRALAEGRIAPDPSVTEHLDNCLACRACETVCPAGVPYGQLLEATRGQMTRRARRRTWMERLGHWALETLMPHRERMHLAADLMRLTQAGPLAWARALMPGFARRGMETLPPLLPRRERGLEALAGRLPAGARIERRADALVFHPATAPRAHAAFFTACVQEVMFPRVNQEAVRLLLLAGCRVTVPAAQTCCGALHAHAGLRRTAQRLAARNAGAFGGNGFDFVVSTSAGCGAALRDYGHLLEGGAEAARGEGLAARARDLSEVLDELGLPAAWRSLAHPDGRPLRVAVHDPCHLAHAQKVRAGPRRLVGALPGVARVELANADWCCGSAGVYNLTHPEMADRQLERKLETIEAAAADVVIASNPGCQLHIQRGLRARGRAERLVHLAELLGSAYPAERA